jgi:zinc protease
MSVRAVALTALVTVLFAAGRSFGAPAKGTTAKGGTVLDGFLGDVRRTVLPNGLTVLTRAQPGSGVVAINTWVKAGYFNEPDEVAGMAHLFEHMFFKGSKKFPGAEEIAREISKVGGQSNAGTIYDSTNYYVVLPKEGFRRGLEIEADAIANPRFDPAELEKESEVVIEESNRKLDNPPAVSLERMFATAFTQHRMKRWRIGSNEVLRSINRDNLLAFFETLYRPENIILTIAGDVAHDEALAAAKATFGTIPKGTLRKGRGPSEPKQDAFRFGQSTADLKQGYSVMGWHTVGVGHPDEVALDVVAAILGDGRASRLYGAVVSPDGASTVTASQAVFDDVGILSIQASFDEANRAEVDRRALAEVARLVAHGPTAYELRRVVNRVESAFVLGLQGVLGQALALSQAEANEGYRSLATRLRNLHALTPEKVKDAAARYLTAENLTLYHYRPKGTTDLPAEQALAAVRAAIGRPPEAVAAQPLPAPPESVRPAAADREPVVTKLANGATLVVRERPGAPVVSAGVYFRGGGIGENSATAGITQLMTRVMQRGTRNRSAEQIDSEIEFLGTEIGTDLDSDYFGFRLDILRTNARAGLDLLADVILNPTFPAEGLEEERHIQMGAIRRAFDSSTTRPLQLAYRDLWGAHPYALPQSGTLESVQAIDAAALRAWWERTVRARDAVIFMVGDIALDDAKAVAEASFGRLSASEPSQAATLPLAVPAARIETVEYRDRKQSAIVVIFPTVPASNPDWPKLRLIGSVTSGLAGTFFAELRGRRSLAYTVFAADASRKDAGAFVSYLATEASKEAEATAALVGEIRRLQADGMTEPDVERARTYFAGSTRIRLQTSGDLLEDYAGNHLYGLGLDWTTKLLATVATLTLDDLKAVSAKYFSTDNYVLAVLRGKAEPPRGAAGGSATSSH